MEWSPMLSLYFAAAKTCDMNDAGNRGHYDGCR